jgi:outer membrane protein OmpA-like peptidoglycan-associated protein/flagellar hook assembly protein FlgD
MKPKCSYLKKNILATLCLITAGSLFAYDPPTGGELTPSWYSPLFMGGGYSVTSSGSPSADAVNPAAEAAQQRFTLDLSYAALLGLGAEDGWGHVINLGASMPNSFGVFGAGMRFFYSPVNDFVSMPLGSAFDLRGTFAKELSDKLWIGLGISGRVGQRADLDWSLGADLGFLAKAGDLGFMKNFRWGGVLAGLGKWYSPGAVAGGGTGASGDIDIAFSSPFTVKAGVGFDFVKNKSVRLSATGDAAAPFFQNLIVDLGLGFSYKEIFGVTVGWGFNLREAIWYWSGAESRVMKSLIPSFGFQASLPITTSKDKESFLAKQGWDQSDLRPSFSVQPLYNDIWAFGAGVTLPLGVVDRKAPRIQIEYPKTEYDMYYMSPNSDGKNDELSLPLNIIDERYVMGYSLKIMNEKGDVVREIQNKESRPETVGFKQVMSQLMYSKKGVVVPKEVKWDGRTTAGATAPDGVYTVKVESIDDNGNRGESEPYKVAVDSTPPTAAITAPKDPNGLIFSPDGDGKKDDIVIRASGSKEDLWKVEVRDSADKVVRKLDSKDSALGDIRWDGKDDSGKTAPDGVYKVEVASIDRAKNSVAADLPNIIVNTAAVSIYAMANAQGFSPNGDGQFDSVEYSFLVSVAEGVTGWKFVLSGADGKVRKTFDGKGDKVPEKVTWDGKGDDGKIVDGSYTGVLTVTYAKGSQPEAKTTPVVLDTKAPEIVLNIAPVPFSPDNDGEDDEIGIGIGIKDVSDIQDWSLEIDESAVSDTASSGKSRLFMKYEGVGRPAERIVWDGKSLKGELVEAATDYPLRLTVRDVLGNKATAKGVLPVDILVVRDGDRLKIKVPSIVFRPDFDDFKNLPQETVDKNVLVLKRIAQILNKYKSYQVRIEGHANNIGKINASSEAEIMKEENASVLPLSKKRADAVRSYLIQYKVGGDRLTTRGLGSSEPVVDPVDADNRWKNRRVEFILEKK